jgi:multimeric flavodoxin WrbA
MKVLLINGSPHRRGCVYTALEETARTLNHRLHCLRLLRIPRALRAG